MDIFSNIRRYRGKWFVLIAYLYDGTMNFKAGSLKTK